MSAFDNPIPTRTGTVQEQGIRPTASTSHGAVAQGLSSLGGMFLQHKMDKAKQEQIQQAGQIDTQISEGVLGLRQLHIDMDDQKVSSVRRAQIEKAYLGKYNDVRMRQEIISQKNKLTGKTLDDRRTDADKEAQELEQNREALEEQVAEASGWLPEKINVKNLTNKELQTKLLESMSIQSQYSAASSKEALIAAKSNNKSVRDAAEFKSISAVAHASVVTPALQEINQALNEIDLNDQSQVSQLISSIELQRSVLTDSLNEVLTESGLEATTSQMQDLVSATDKTFERSISFLQQTTALKGSENVNKKAVQELLNVMTNSPDEGTRMAGYVIGLNMGGANIRVDSATISSLTIATQKLMMGDTAPNPETDYVWADVGKVIKSPEGTPIPEDVQKANARMAINAFTGVAEDVQNIINNKGLSSFLDGIGNGNSEAFAEEDREQVLQAMAPHIERLGTRLISKFASTQANMSGSTVTSTATSLSQYSFNPDTLQFRITSNNPFDKESSNMRALNKFLKDSLSTYEKLGVKSGDQDLTEAYKQTIQNAIGIVQEEK